MTISVFFLTVITILSAKEFFVPIEGNITRPGVQEVLEYRAYVDMHMQILLQLKSEELKDLL